MKRTVLVNNSGNPNMVNHNRILRQFGDSMRTALSLDGRRPRRRVRSAGASSLQVLESRQLLSSSMIGATAGDLAKPAAMETGQRYSLANFRIDHFDTTSQNELGYYFVDGPDGRITLREDGDPTGAPLLNSQGQPQFVRPGEPGYAAAALAEANSRVVFALGEIGDPDITEATAEFDHDLFVGFYLVQDGTTDDWRAGGADVPDVWFSFLNANADDANHFRRTTSQDPGYRSNVLQYKLEDSNQDNGGDSDFDDLIFSVNRNPVASEDSYAVFNSGDNFEGVPVGFKADAPGDVKNRGQGLLANDMDFRPNTPLVVSGIRLDSSYSWEPVTSGSGTTLSDPSLHGTVTVYANGGIEFVPDPTDSYWTLEEGEEAPESFSFQYQISDGLDTEWHRVYLTHGLYHRGAAPDNRQAGNRMYLLTGGTYPDSLADAKTRFFTQGSAGGDIVMLAQGIDPYDLQSRTDLGVDEYAPGTARSRTMGVGVDEDTALLIEPAPRNDWRWTVYGDGAVYVVGQTRQFRGLQAVTGWTLQTSRLTTGELGVIRLDPTNTAGGILRSRVLTLAPSYRLKVTAGTVFNTNNGGDLYSLFVPQGFPSNRQTLFGNNNAGNLYG